VTRAAERASTLKALPIATSDENQNRPPAIAPAVIRAIGRELRAMYAHIIAEGVPERFAEILRRLDEPNNEGFSPQG
jgi:Anti-sigma factor NepR